MEAKGAPDLFFSIDESGLGENIFRPALNPP
jgi:hypothetical protein